MATKRARLRKHIGEISERRDDDTGIAGLVFRDLRTGELRTSLVGVEFNESCHAWLAIYPTPDMRSLGPVIYRPAEEGGVELIYLNERNFLKMKSIEVITEAEPLSLYDRIKELMGFGTQQFEIFDEWERTASDVLLNPVLRASRDAEQREQTFKNYLGVFWKQRDGA